MAHEDGLVWNDAAMCDGHSAGDRAFFCMENSGLTLDAARQRVMSEFPAQFRGAGLNWDPNLVCDGKLAADRARWCVENCGLSLTAAQERVMAEFPAVFRSSRACWDPNVICDGAPAIDRAQWCVDNCGLSLDAAKQRVMHEFPSRFGAAIVAGTEVAALGGVSAHAIVLVPVSPADPAMLVWSDEFQYTGPPDPEKWGYDIGNGDNGWGNRELQHYTDRAENAWVAEGTLHIRAVCENFEGQRFTSARLVTKNKGDWFYGRVEVRAKVPVGRGSWSAIWMLPTDWNFGQWPRSGEIDIMEHVGHDAGEVHGTVHTDSYNHCKGTQVGRHTPVAVTDWHTYAVEWSHESVVFIIDGNQYHEFRNDGKCSWQTWPFTHPFHLIFNVAVGGDWGGQKGVDEEAFRGEGQVLEIAWVRVYRSS